MSRNPEVNNFGNAIGDWFYNITHLKEKNQDTIQKNNEQINKTIQQIQEESQKRQEEMHKDWSLTTFNSVYKNLYSGMKNGVQVENAIQEVIKTNLNEERKIIVKYRDREYKENKELTGLISRLNKGLERQMKTNYLITYNYDKEGYINQMNIEDV